MDPITIAPFLVSKPTDGRALAPAFGFFRHPFVASLGVEAVLQHYTPARGRNGGLYSHKAQGAPIYYHRTPTGYTPLPDKTLTQGNDIFAAWGDTRLDTILERDLPYVSSAGVYMLLTPYAIVLQAESPCGEIAKFAAWTGQDVSSLTTARCAMAVVRYPTPASRHAQLPLVHAINSALALLAEVRAEALVEARERGYVLGRIEPDLLLVQP